MEIVKKLKIYNGMNVSKKTGYPTIDRPWEKYYSKHVLNQEFPDKKMYEVIYENNKHYLGRTAINYLDKKISYGELFDKIEETAKSLKAYGINANDVVTICMPTTPETIYLFYALNRIGAISNMVDPRTSSEGIKEYVKEANSKMLIIIDQYKEKAISCINENVVQNVLELSPVISLPFPINFGYEVGNIIASTFKNQLPKNSTIKWHDFIKEGKNYNGNLDEKIEPNTPATIMHTGGTTGTPKGVLLSNEAFNAIAYQYKTSGMYLFPNQKFLNIMPPFIAYGIGCGLHMPLVVGMTVIPIPKLDPKKLGNLIAKYEPQHMAGVPTHWDYIQKSRALNKKDLSYLITPAIGGDGINVKKEREINYFLQKHNCFNKLTKGYGITEECSLATACINEINKEGSVGIPLPQNIIGIFDPETTEELTYNQEGEICILCQSRMNNYLGTKNNSEEILKKHEDGNIWIHTKDLGYMDEEGFLYVKGRIKKMITRHDGFKVFPPTIEKIILEHNAVRDCIVVGIPDENHSQGMLPKAHIILNENYDLKQAKEEIMALCKKKLPEYAVPIDYKIRDSFPITKIGKIDFIQLMKEEVVENKVRS